MTSFCLARLAIVTSKQELQTSGITSNAINHLSIKPCLSLLIFVGWTLIMHKPDKRSSDIVDGSQVFTLRKVLNDLSAVQVVTGRVRAIQIAWRTAGNKSACLSIPWSSPTPPCSSCFSLRISNHVAASASKFSILYNIFTSSTCFRYSFSLMWIMCFG